MDINTSVKFKNGVGEYVSFECEDDGFVLATFDPNTYDFIHKLKQVHGIEDVTMMYDKEGMNLKLQNNLDLVGIRRKPGKIGEYEIVVKLIK